MNDQKIANDVPSRYYNEQQAELKTLGFVTNTNNHWTNVLNNMDVGPSIESEIQNAGVKEFLQSARLYENETTELELNERNDSMLFERFIPFVILGGGLVYFLWWQ